MKISKNCKLFNLACIQLRREGKGEPVRIGEMVIFEHDVGDIFETMRKILVNANKRKLEL